MAAACELSKPLKLVKLSGRLKTLQNDARISKSGAKSMLIYLFKKKKVKVKSHQAMKRYRRSFSAYY